MSVTTVLDRPEEASRGGWIFTQKQPDPVWRAKDLREAYDAAVPGGFRCLPLPFRLLPPRCCKALRLAFMKVSHSEETHTRPRRHRGRCTAPLVVDKKSKALVCNESSDLVRMLNVVKAGKPIDLFPVHLRVKIDELNEWVYKDINNGVYRCGFSTTQGAYDTAEQGLFAALDRVEGILTR